MIVAYYTNDEGIIVRHHKIPDDMNPLELQEKIAEYNKKSRDKAHVKEIADGGLEAYLFDLANRKLRLNVGWLSFCPGIIGLLRRPPRLLEHAL